MNLKDCLTRTLIVLLVVWVVLIVTVSYLQRPRSYILILDASVSMRERLYPENISKMDAAKDAISRFATALGEEDRVGLVVFYDCDDIRVELPPGSPPERLMDAVKGVEPDNQTPIAGALRLVDRLLSNLTLDGWEYHVVLITDGVEFCGDDPLSAAEDLWIHSGERARIDVVSVMIPPYVEEVTWGIEGGPCGEPTGRKIPVRPIYIRIVEMTGGTFVDVKDVETFRHAMIKMTESKWEVLKYYYWGVLLPLGLLICLGLRAREEEWCVLRCSSLSEERRARGPREDDRATR